LDLAASHDTPDGKCFKQKWLPSTPPVSYHTLQVESGHGLGNTREYVPSSHPAVQSLHAAADVLPAREYGVAGSHSVHCDAPAALLYRPAGHTVHWLPKLYLPALHRVCTPLVALHV